MNTDHHLLSRNVPSHAGVNNPWSHVLIWVLVTVAAVLLVGFTAVVEDVTQRGELRRVQQRMSGSSTLTDQLQTSELDVTHLLSMTGDKSTGR